ncbi:hypothetical protein As57867_001108, partial [Aphanomyces stellatus]
WDAAEAARERQAAALAVTKLRFALWKRFVVAQKQPRHPANLAYTPPLPTTGASHVHSALCPVPRVVPLWTHLDADVSTHAHAASLALHERLYAPLDVAGALARSFGTRYPHLSVVEFAMGVWCDDAVSSWLVAKCGLGAVDLAVQRTSLCATQTVVVSLHKYPSCATHHDVDVVVAAMGPRHVPALDAALKHLVATVGARSLAVHVVCVSSHVTRADLDSLCSLHSVPNGVHLVGHAAVPVLDDRANTAVDALLVHVAAAASIRAPRSRVSVRDAVDDVIRISLHQCSPLTTHLADVAAHVQHALTVLAQLARRASSSSSLAMVLLDDLSTLPLPAAQSSVAWITRLPLSAARRDLCVRLADHAWQHDASPLKAIVSIVFHAVLDQSAANADADAMNVMLPTSWVVECDQLLRSIVSLASPPPPRLPKRKATTPPPLPLDDLMCSMIAPQKKTLATTATTPFHTTRRSLQAKWTQDALRKRVVDALAIERAAHRKMMQLLESTNCS